MDRVNVSPRLLRWARDRWGLLDANVVIQAKNLHHGFDFCPASDWHGTISGRMGQTGRAAEEAILIRGQLPPTRNPPILNALRRFPLDEVALG